MESFDEEESMWKKKKDQSLLETSRIRGHMTWSRIHLKPSRNI